MPDGAAYFTSRASVMGQVHGHVVAATFAVFNPAVVVPAIAFGWSLTDATTICTARDEGSVAQLHRILGDEPAGLHRAVQLLLVAVEGLRPEGKPLYAGLSSLAMPEPPLGVAWRLADMLREYRGDAHITAWTGAGFDAPEIGLLTELYWGLKPRTYQRTRAWSSADLDAAQERLQSRGLIDESGAALTAEGHDRREAVETRTDALCAAITDPLGEGVEELITLVGAWSADIKAAGGYMASGPKGLAERMTPRSTPHRRHGRRSDDPAAAMPEGPVASRAMEHVVWSRRPALTNPTMIAAFAGWNDAGDAATLAVRHLIQEWAAEPIAAIDPEEYFDFQATRPQVHLVGRPHPPHLVAGQRGLRGIDPGGDVVLLLGVEPQLRWRTFTHQIAGIAEETGTDLVVTLGALLADVVHHRPVSLIGTATDQALIDRFELQRSRYEGPTGIVGVLHDTCQQLGVSLAVAVGGRAGVRVAGALAQGRAGPGRGGVRGGRHAVPGPRLGGRRWPSTRPRSTATWPRTTTWRLRPPAGAHGRRDDDEDDDDGQRPPGRARGPSRSWRRRRADGRGHRALPPRPGRQLSRLSRAAVAPDVGARRIERGRQALAPDRREGHRAPPRRATGGPRQLVRPEPPDAAGLQRMGLELAADGPAVEEHHVHAEAGEAHAQAVDDAEELHRLALDAGLLPHLLERDLDRRVADVGPAGRVEPDAGVGPLDQEQATLVVADDGPHGHLRGDVAGHALAHRLEPLLDEVVLLPPHLQRVVGRGLDVGGHLQDLLVALPLVEALGEAEPGPGDAGQRLAPADEVPGEVDRTGAVELGGLVSSTPTLVHPTETGRRQRCGPGPHAAPGSPAWSRARSSSARWYGSVTLPSPPRT